jgi:hypothetical protein
MLKSLVCVNDGLLKLRIKRILSEKNISHVITEKPIKRDELVRYDIVIVHSSYNLSNLFNFIENAIIQKLTTFIYITTNINSNPFRKFNDYVNLIMIDENKMDIELLLSIELFSKYNQQIKELLSENRRLANSLDEINLMNSCKRKLMKEKNLTEGQAHKFILKFAMDNHLDKKEACNRLLENYAK